MLLPALLLALAAAQSVPAAPLLEGGFTLSQEPQAASETGAEAGPGPEPEIAQRAGQSVGQSASESPGQDSGQEAEPAQTQPTASEKTAAAAVATVAGVVRNGATGEPLPRALVRIEGDADAGALTDGEGRFEIPGVALGPQTFRLLKPGFLDRPYATEEIGYESDGPAHSVLVAAGMGDLSFALSPTSSIHGHIELSTGDPALGLTVTLMKQVVRNGRAVWTQDATTKTNGDGAYRFAGLPDGVYVIYTQAAIESEPAVTLVAPGSGQKVARGGYPSVFYPEARDFSGASRIHLTGGQQAEANLSLTLETFYTVTATAFAPNGRPYGDNRTAETSLSPQLLDAAGHRLAYIAQYDGATHTIQASLPDGAYILLVQAAPDETVETSAAHRLIRPSAKQPYLAGFAEFSVAGHAVANLRIPLSPVASWPVRLSVARSAGHAGQSAVAAQGLQNLVTVTATDSTDSPSDTGGGGAMADLTGTDLLELNSSGPGSYWIGTQVNDRSLCVGSFTAGGINLAREPLNLALTAAAPPMELTLRDDCSKLALELPQALAAFAPGEEPFYTVYVVPEFDTTAEIPPLTVHPSSGATVTVDGLTPGNYRVYTFERPVRLEYRNPAALAALPLPGQAVTLSPGATTNLVLEAPAR
jgi:hypothetical protein